MVDPFSAAQLSIEGTAICVAAIKKLKRYVESVKHAEQEMQTLLGKTDRIRSVLELLRIVVVELQGSEFRDMQIAIHDDDCRRLMEDVLSLANSIVDDGPNISARARFMWAKRTSEAQSLVRRIETQEAELTRALIIINTASSLNTQKRIQKLTEYLEAKLTVESAFDKVLIDNESVRLQVDDTKNASENDLMKTWLGHTVSDDMPAHYLHWRKALSDACYMGQWSQIWDILSTARDEYNENWVNAPRMKTAAQSHEMSFWTPLHQAVYTGASVDVIQHLLEQGASRTMRTRRSDYSHQNLSPLELAREIGALSLLEILAPVIYNPVPRGVLQALQNSFHSIIENDLGSRVSDENLYLPDLEVLTELRDEPMWFPVRIQQRRYAGYIYRLDGRDLLVRSFYVGESDEVKTYRITEHQVFNVHEAILLKQSDVIQA